MNVCDRCFKQAISSAELTGRGHTDLCDRCYSDLQDLVTAFMAGDTLTVTAVDIAPQPSTSDPRAHNVEAPILDQKPLPPISEPAS